MDGLYSQVELAGRTCYKSENLITPDSAYKFVTRMINAGHGAMLEHGTVYLTIENYNDADMVKYNRNKYSRIVVTHPDNILYVTTNLRVLVDNGWMEDLQYMTSPTEYHEKRVTVKFTCDRGISHEFVRHRVFSFAQESTRYCNYSKDKFSNELTFIKPEWYDECEDEIDKEDFETYLINSEEYYCNLINKRGFKPQQARAILPNALKTELVMTGFVSDWEGFFKLRDDNHAHPDAQVLAGPLHEEFIKKGYIDGRVY